MGDRITVYEKPTCTTCRNLVMMLKDKGYDFDRIEYLIDPIGRDKLQELLRKMSGKPRDLIRTKEEKYRQLGLDRATDDQLLDALVAHPDLLQRPIVEKGERAIIARPIDRINEIL